jgi:dipeptidyl aminopeptidase/acylaminoacyl peptidase
VGSGAFGGCGLRFVLCLAFAFVAFAFSAAAAPPLDAYGALPAIDMVSLSPSGERFALVARSGEERKLYVRRIDGTAEVVAPIGVAKVRDIEWAGDDHLILIVSSTIYAPVYGLARQEWASAITVNLKTHESKMVFNKSNQLIDAVFGWYGVAKIDGRWNAFVGGISIDQARRQMGSGGAAQPGLYRVDLDTGEYRLVEPAFSGRTGWVVGADGVVIARGGVDARGRTFTLIAGPRGSDPVLVRAEADNDSDSEIGLQGAGRSPGAFVIAERTEDDVVAREFKPGGPPEGEVLLRGGNSARPLTDAETGLLIGSTTLGGEGVQLFDPALQRRVTAARKAFPGRRASLVSYGRGLDRMVVLTDGPEDSGTYWLVDIAQKSAVPIGQVRPEIKPADVGPMRMFAYKAADGLAMEGVLTLPPGAAAKNLPLVVLPHGGPLVPGDRPGFDWWAQAFASRGYAVLQPNYRGTLGYGQAFRSAAFGQFGGKMQTDLSDGVAALAAQGLIDPKRVCIVGASYGGYAALAGVTVQQGAYRCAVSVSGLSDVGRFVTWVGARQGPDRRVSNFWRALFGTSRGVDVNSISPIRRVAAADAPILLIHGKDDSVVPVEQSQAMERALRQAGKPVELVVMDGEDHWLSREATRQTMLRSAVAFVEKNNPPR